MTTNTQAPTEEQVLWVAYTNTDRTEGRGHEVPHAVCELKSTAIRLARGIGPMGTDGNVGPVKLLRHDGKLYAPYTLMKAIVPTAEDKRAETMRNAREKAVEKAKAAGLTDDDIKALRG